MQLLRFGRGRILEVRMGRPDRTRDPIDLVPAPVNAPRLVEHAIFGEDLVDGRAPTRGVVFTEDVVKIAGQQGRYAVGHGLSPLGIECSLRYLDPERLAPLRSNPCGASRRRHDRSRPSSRATSA